MIYTLEETCPGPRECVSAELCEMQRLKIPRDGRGQAKDCPELGEWIDAWFTKYPRGYDEKGFYFCSYCNKPHRSQLVQCPDCLRFFQGPRPDMSIDYECTDCE